MDTEFTALVQAMLREADVIREDRGRIIGYNTSVQILNAFDSILKPFGDFYYSEDIKRHVLFRGRKGVIYCHYEQDDGEMPL